MKPLIALLLLTTAAMAQPQCGPRATIVKDLESKFGETVVEAGPTENGWLMEMFENPNTRTWTITMSQGDMACLLAAGREITRTPPGDPA